MSLGVFNICTDILCEMFLWAVSHYQCSAASATVGSVT